MRIRIEDLDVTLCERLMKELNKWHIPFIQIAGHGAKGYINGVILNNLGDLEIALLFLHDNLDEEEPFPEADERSMNPNDYPLSVNEQHERAWAQKRSGW